MWTNHLESCLVFIFWSTCPYQKSIFLFMSTCFDMAAILFLEVVIFSNKEKSVFQLWWKNTSSHKKIYKTKKLYLIGLHMEWFKIFHLKPKPEMLQLKIWYFEKCKKFQNLPNFLFFFGSKNCCQGLKTDQRRTFFLSYGSQYIGSWIHVAE